MTVTVFVDTNVIVYSLDAAKKRSRSALSNGWTMRGRAGVAV
jgi:predicted nucleic acid-binding protein